MYSGSCTPFVQGWTPTDPDNTLNADKRRKGFCPGVPGRTGRMESNSNEVRHPVFQQILATLRYHTRIPGSLLVHGLGRARPHLGREKQPQGHRRAAASQSHPERQGPQDTRPKAQSCVHSWHCPDCYKDPSG